MIALVARWWRACVGSRDLESGAEPALSLSRSRAALLFVILTALGLGGNSIGLPLFPGVEVVFGSVFSMLALQLLGARAGIASALLASSVTLLLWNHPYAIVVLTAEATAVALLRGDKRFSFVVADALYWCVIGMPLVFLFQHYALGQPPVSAGVSLLKDAINGIASALVARLLFMAISRRLGQSAFSMREMIFNFMFLLVLLPSLLFVVTHTRQEHTALDQRIRKTLQVTGARTATLLDEWVESHMRSLAYLARRAASQPPPYMQRVVEQLQEEEADFLRVALVDAKGTIVAHSQRVDELGQPNSGRQVNDPPDIPRLKQSLAPALGEVVLARTGRPEPVVPLLAPVAGADGAYAGYAVGLLNLVRLEMFVALNSRNALSASDTYTLLDRSGKVILSNDARQKIMQPLLRAPGRLIQLDDGLMQWLPAADRGYGKSVTEHWEDATYIKESPVGGISGWKLVREVPAQAFALQQYADYSWILSRLAVTLLLGLLLAELLSRRIATQLEDLHRITATLTQNLLARIDVDWGAAPSEGAGAGAGAGAGSILEIQLLKDDFRDIAGLLAEKIDEAAHARLFLESEVARRTAELRESERFARATVDALTASLAILDQNGVILAVNRAWRRFVVAGEAAAEHVGEGVNYLAVCDAASGTDGAGAAEIAAGIRALLQGGRDEFLLEYACDIPAGRLWFLCRVTRFAGEGELRAVVAHEDITERKAAEAAVRKLSRAVEQSPASVVITDLEGRIEYVNPRFEANTGYSKAEALGANPSILKSGQTPAAIYSEMWQIIAAGGEWRGDLCNSRKDGSLFWESAAISGIVDENGKVSHYLAVKEDITGRKANEEQLRVAKDAAEAANVAKSRFLAAMSHEIRTPMNAILGLAQVMQMPGVSEAERQDYAATILGSGKTLLALLNDILDLSKVEAGKVELEAVALDPAQLIGEAQALFAQAARSKGLRLDAGWSGAPQQYLADPHRLRQMLSNLVSNAVKFTAQGEVRIEGREVGEAGEGEQTALLEFSVSDSGIGIAEGDQARLFQSFSQTDSSITRRYGGSGLGLSLVDRFARLMGGEVGVDSEVGRGSRFWFRICAGRVAAAAGTLPLPPFAAAPAGQATQLSGRVLVVEDNPDNRKVIGILLHKLGLDTLQAEDGQQALDALAAGEAVDLILMDVQMPGVDGYAASAALRQREHDSGAPRRPIVGLTAEVFAEDRRRCLAAGMDDVLTKPIVFEALQAMLGRWLPAAAGATTAAAPAAELPLDTARVVALVAALLPLLERNKFDALGRFKDLQDAVAGTAVAAEIYQAGRPLQEMDFAATLQRLRRLATTYGWDTSS